MAIIPVPICTLQVSKWHPTCVHPEATSYTYLCCRSVLPINRSYSGVVPTQALIADKFDPDKVDTLLHTRKGPPKWLTPLIADRAGRELIYTLSARYKNCQLLKYAMQRILKAGHDDEVASVGSRLSGYFEVFHNLMEKRLEEMLTADDARMQVLSRELQVMLAMLGGDRAI